MQGIDDLTWDKLAILLALCALASSSITQVVRAWAKPKMPNASSRKAVLRAVSVAVGALFGWMLESWPIGIVIGVASGSLTTTVVAAVKERIKGRRGPSVDVDF